MSDAGFDAFRERRAAERAAAPPKVTWRAVSPLTGGGHSGLGPGGQLVYVRWVGPDDRRGEWEYGRVEGRERVAVGTERLLMEAKRLAVELVAR